MHYEFPANIKLEEVRAAINNCNTRLGTQIYIEADRGNYVIFNYLISCNESFPNPALAETPELAREYAILRECRGLTFFKDGRLATRKYAKFFNANEKAETQVGVIDWTKPHVILEKLDGSMITPLLLGERLTWATKMGETDVAGPVIEFCRARPQYEAFVREMIAENKTPIFEWCSRQQRIVIDYPEDQLIMTAIRDNETGGLLSHQAMQHYGELHGIPVVKVFEGGMGEIDAFLEYVYGLKDCEGFIIRFADGHQVKIKGEWYCQIHGVKEILNFEKDVLSRIVHDNIDDSKAFMLEEDRRDVERYETAVKAGIASAAQRLARLVDVARITTGGEKRQFAIDLNQQTLARFEKPMLFLIWDGHDPHEVVANVVRQQAHPTAGTQRRVDECRHLIGDHKWLDYRKPVFAD